MAKGKLSGKTKVEGVLTPGLSVEAHERSGNRTFSVFRTNSDASGSWAIYGLDTEKTYDVVMRTPTKGAVISDTRRPVLDDTPADGFYNKVVLQTSFDNLTQDDLGNKIVVAGSPSVVVDPQRGNVLNIPSAGGHAIKFDVVNGGPLDLSGDDFTIEMWVKITGTGSTYGYPFSLGGGLNYSWHACSFGMGPNGNVANWALRSRVAEKANANPDINYYRSATDPSSSSPFTGRWVHVAVTRAEDVFRIFLNGRIADSVSGSSTSAAWYPLMKYANLSGISVGAPFWSDTGLPAEGLQCMLDDLRITRACRYQENFTPPATI